MGRRALGIDLDEPIDSGDRVKSVRGRDRRIDLRGPGRRRVALARSPARGEKTERRQDDER
jgi:hypothetical protein